MAHIVLLTAVLAAYINGIAPLERAIIKPPYEWASQVHHPFNVPLEPLGWSQSYYCTRREVKSSQDAFQLRV